MKISIQKLLQSSTPRTNGKKGILFLFICMFQFGYSQFTGPGIETESAQALYSLPRDHAYHGGKFYQTNDFNEWHYITILGKDLDTGDDVSVFWTPLSQGWMKEDNRPLQIGLFSYHNIKTGEFHTALVWFDGKFNSEGTPPDAKDFRFKYAMQGKETGFTTEYTHTNETWHFTANSSVKTGKNAPFELDFTSQAKFPGYLPAAYFGLESIGIDPKDRQNPETMYGLTYYYVGPNMETNGTLKVAGKTIRFKGTGWLERQWGNFRNTYQYRYFYGYGRYTNGDMFSWRQYYEGAGFTKPLYEYSRYQFIDGKTGKREHAFGPAIKAEPTKWWTSPSTGQKYPWWGKMTTPKGVLYYGPSHPDQEGVGLAGGFIEGVIQFREGSPEGKIVATGFCEIVDLSKPMADGNDPSMGPAITRTLPEMPELEYKPKGDRVTPMSGLKR